MLSEIGLPSIRTVMRNTVRCHFAIVVTSELITDVQSEYNLLLIIFLHVHVVASISMSVLHCSVLYICVLF